MSYRDVQPPDRLPILSPGKHRNPRTGACFMELASLLAGERWSDHPACTHPLLAALARQVNDHTSDAGRQRLAELIPSVIGLTGEDLHIDARIALRSATMALPVVAAERQRVLAVSVLTCERVLAELEGRAPGALEEQSRLALAKAPQAAEWADQFTVGIRPSAKGFRRQAAPTIVQDAVEGIARACVPDPDGMLRDLLVQAIDVCAALVGRDPGHGEVVDRTWRCGSRGAGLGGTRCGLVVEVERLGDDGCGPRRIAITMARSSGNAFFANFSTYDAPFPTKVRLVLANSWRKVRTRSDCCGNYGQPGC